MKLKYQKDLFLCYTEYSVEQTWILRIFMIYQLYNGNTFVI